MHGEKHKSHKLFVLALSVILILAESLTAFAEDYDLVINNGRVMDPETMYDDVANVGIRDGKIAVITREKITGTKTIDATGHVVAPGFIDEHFHWTRVMGYKLGLRDGVTTAINLEVGTLGTYVDQWYKEREGKTQLNYGCATSHEFARSLILDGATAHDTPEAQQSRGPVTAGRARSPIWRKGTRSSRSSTTASAPAPSVSAPRWGTCAMA